MMAPLWNAMIMLLVIFVESTASQLVERDDGYVLIQRHKNVANGMFSSSVSTSGVENAYDPEANTYCIIGSVDSDDFQYDDGRYELQLIYKNSDGTTDTLDWSQTSWVNADTATGVDLSRIVDSKAGSSCSGFNGLAKSSTTAAYLDGSPDCGSWFHPVGCIATWNGGIPGHEETVAYSSELWVQRVHCATNGCDDPLICNEDTGECQRDCDILHIDEFLDQCSNEWDSNAAALAAMDTSIATNTADIATVTASAATNTANIAATTASTATNAASIAAIETEGISVESRLSAVESTLSRLAIGSAHSVAGNVDAPADLAQSGSLTIGSKDVTIFTLGAVNLVLLTSMAVVCCRKQRGSAKYEAVSIASD